jgi:asparagine synthase (glutamine-hydrolysing)
MKILGALNKKGSEFSFKVFSNGGEIDIKTFNFLDKKILLHIDGIISRLSDQAKNLTMDIESIDCKIAYLYSIDFNIESHVHGSFNMYIYDFINDKLKIIRDSRGTKAIFFANLEHKFIFSSNIESVLNDIEHLTLNKDKLIDFLNWDYRANTDTYFNEIKTIEPKHYLLFHKNKILSKTYSFDASLFEDRNSKNALEDFKNHLYRSIECVPKEEKTIGLMMSGGLDSSAIAIALKENDFKNVKTYSANFLHINNYHKIDETKYQKNISDVTSFEHTSISMQNKSTMSPIKKFTKVFNKPILFPNIYIFEEIIKELKNDNVNIILDGNDGDNTVSHGYEVLYSYITSLRFFKFTKEVYLYSNFKNSNFFRLFIYFTKQALKILLNRTDRKIKNTILREDINIITNPKNDINIFSSHKSKLSIDLHFLANEDRDILFRHFNMENFSPFYDESLINFCINMKKKNKFQNGYTRKILRDFLAEFLPKKHANRDKSILTPGLLKNFSKSKEDINIIKSELNKVNKQLHELMDVDKLERIVRNVESGKQLAETDLINLQIFLSANTFLNRFNF